MNIKFRGVNHETGEFVFGSYARLLEGARIFDAIISIEDGELVRYYIHDKKSIGQYLGKQDSQGVDIYAGDIIDDSFVGIGVVEYSKRHAAFRVCYGNSTCKWFLDFLDIESRLIVVIGNSALQPEIELTVYSNPEGE